MNPKKTRPSRKKQKAEFVIEEYSGDQFASLQEAQSAALKPLAADIAETIRTLIAQGILVIENGRVVIKESENNGSLNSPTART